jgi:NADH dehydrogenase [ubiquinone] 1 alpha subcomplex assembly factor 3
MNRFCKGLILRRFSKNSEDPFLDSEGRFKTRWNIKENPTIQIIDEKDIPRYKYKIDFKVDKKRIFDFELPKEFHSIESPLQIWSVSDTMFSINQVWVPGPILIFPEAVFKWHATRACDIQDHHLDILRSIRPKIEYALIGTGKQQSIDFSDSLRHKMQMIGINVDICPTVRNK